MANRINVPGLANAGREPIAAAKPGSTHRDERTEEELAKRDRLTDAFQGPSNGSRSRERPQTAQPSWLDRLLALVSSKPQQLKQAAVVILAFTAVFGLLVLLFAAI